MPLVRAIDPNVNPIFLLNTGTVSKFRGGEKESRKKKSPSGRHTNRRRLRKQSDEQKAAKEAKCDAEYRMRNGGIARDGGQ